MDSLGPRKLANSGAQLLSCCLLLLLLFHLASHASSAANSPPTTLVSSPTTNDEQQQAPQSTAPSAASILSRLDEIQDSLKILTNKYSQLQDVVLASQLVCQPAQLQPQPQQAAHQAANNRFARGDDGGGAKAEEAPSEPNVQQRDLFHFNKLARADHSNSIPASSLPWTPKDESNALNAADWSVGGNNANFIGNNEPQSSSPQTNVFNNLSHYQGTSEQKRLILSIGQHYESIFGFALENLSAMLKEQLAAFRLILIKLMNRIVDHSYQYNMIANQLSIIKDECSLAASSSQPSQAPGAVCQQSSSSSSTADQSSPAHPAGGAGGAGSFRAAPQELAAPILRSSDITMLVRLLSQELDHSLMNAHKATAAQLDNSETTTLLINETKSLLTSRLDEISSVVKQSALLLTKLSNSNLNPMQSSSEKQQGLFGLTANKQQVNIMTFTNLNETDSAASTIDNVPSAGFSAAAATAAQRPTRRWFPGSKVPGKTNSREETGESSSKQRAEAATTATTIRRGDKWCQTKTSQIKPSSCQQLRLAGANCTGQYYVFVRGFIRHVYCDMNMDSEDDGGGWTVIMRRIDKSLAAKNTNNNNTNNSTSQSTAGGDINQQQQQQQHLAKPPTNQLLELFKASQVNFDLDWQNYRTGFGHLESWSEFFVGLDLLHQLTTGAGSDTSLAGLSNDTELQLDLETSESNELHLRFSKFSVANESKQYELSVGNCNSSEASLCDTINNLNGAKFYTFDRLVNETTINSAGLPANKANNMCETKTNNQTNFGWWLPADSGGNIDNEQEAKLDVGSARKIWARKSTGVLALTRPIGRLAQVKVAANCSDQGQIAGHLYWPNWPGHSNEPLRKIVLKIRRRRLPGVAPQLT